MQFGTLEHVAIDTLAEAFNASFADYEIPLQLSPQMLQHKIATEDIDLSISAGAFNGDRLAGFIFFGIDAVNNVVTAWDGGTGVLPEYRGQKLTQRMFEYILPLLKERQVSALLLEVLENNHGARKIYEKIGFRIVRKLNAYKGSVSNDNAVCHDVIQISSKDFPSFSSMRDFQPAWQQMDKRVANWGANVTTIGIKEVDEIVAYAHYNTQTNRAVQFAVAKSYRRRGMGKAMFQYIQRSNGLPVSVVNVDDRSTATKAFLETIGLQPFINQHEMKMEL